MLSVELLWKMDYLTMCFIYSDAQYNVTDSSNKLHCTTNKNKKSRDHVDQSDAHLQTSLNYTVNS